MLSCHDRSKLAVTQHGCARMGRAFSHAHGASGCHAQLIRCVLLCSHCIVALLDLEVHHDTCRTARRRLGLGAEGLVLAVDEGDVRESSSLGGARLVRAHGLVQGDPHSHQQNHLPVLIVEASHHMVEHLPCVGPCSRCCLVVLHHGADCSKRQYRMYSWKLRASLMPSIHQWDLVPPQMDGGLFG